MGLTKMPDVLNGYKWELYNVAEDYSQANDLAAKNPDKLRELQELFLVEAAKYNVFPLDNDILQRILAPKPSYVAGRTEFTYAGGLTGTPNSNAPNILARSYTITADIEVPAGGGDGMIRAVVAADVDDQGVVELAHVVHRLDDAADLMVGVGDVGGEDLRLAREELLLVSRNFGRQNRQADRRARAKELRS